MLCNLPFDIKHASGVVNRLGLANAGPGLEVHEADGIAFLSSRVNDIQSRLAPYIDFLFLDVFDGNDVIPDGFTLEGQP